LSAFSRMQHVLSTTTSASSTSSVATMPSATNWPAIRSESCSFIWHPKVRTRKRLAGSGVAAGSVMARRVYGRDPRRSEVGTRAGAVRSGPRAGSGSGRGVGIVGGGQRVGGQGIGGGEVVHAVASRLGAGLVVD